MTTGLRAGEIWGLTWDDVDLVDGELTVRRSLNEAKLKRGLPVAEALDEPKTRKALRRVAPPQAVIGALTAHREGQRVRSVANLVFTDSQGGPVRHNNFCRRVYRPLLRRADLPEITFHDLRHTAATLMLVAGVNYRTVSETLGHASASFTMATYAHVIESMKREAAEKMDQLLKGAVERLT